MMPPNAIPLGIRASIYELGAGHKRSVHSICWLPFRRRAPLPSLHLLWTKEVPENADDRWVWGFRRVSIHLRATTFGQPHLGLSHPFLFHHLESARPEGLWEVRRRQAGRITGRYSSRETLHWSVRGWVFLNHIHDSYLFQDLVSHSAPLQD